MKLLLLLNILFFLNLDIRGDTTIPIIGKGNYSFLFLDIYEATLRATNKNNLYSGKLELELSYKMNFKGEDIVDQTKKEFKSAGVDTERIRKWGSILYPIFPNVRKGDRILAKYDPSRGIKFYLNKKILLGEVNDIEFSRAFLDIWLGAKTTEPNLRDQLKGINDE